MENIIIFILSLIFDLNEFDKFRLNSYFSKDNQKFSQFLAEEKLYYTSLNYKIKDDKYIEKITFSKNTFESIKEVRISTYKNFSSFDINQYKYTCSLENCSFFFESLKVKNLNIDFISTSIFNDEFIFSFRNKSDTLLSERKLFDILNDENMTNLIIDRFTLNDFLKEIEKEKNFDVYYFNLLNKKININHFNMIEIDSLLANYVNKKKYKTAYVTYKDGSFFLNSKIYFRTKNIINDKQNLSNQDFSNIRKYFKMNSNLGKINLSYKFFVNNLEDIFFKNATLVEKIFFFAILFISIIILFLSKNLFFKYKFLFYLCVVYFVFIDSLFFNFFAIFFLFYFFLLKKKYLKYVKN